MSNFQGHIQGISRDMYGVPEGANRPLETPNGGVSVGPRLDSYALSQTITSSRNYVNLQRLEAICLATGMSPGYWNIRGASGGAILQVLQKPAIATPGLRYVWDFPTPLQTGNENSAFQVEPSASGMGTWFFFANGYETQVAQSRSGF